MSDIPPDSKGSGASPADPDQPTQAPPRPATKGSSAVTRPPGLRCPRGPPAGAPRPGGPPVGVGARAARQPVAHHDDGAVRLLVSCRCPSHTAPDPTER